MYWLADQDPETLTDEQIGQWLRVNVETLHHPVSPPCIVHDWRRLIPTIYEVLHC